jgi:GGDEF domain-containing protein
MVTPRSENCRKDECAKLIEELSLLRQQLKDAESQVKFFKAREKSEPVLGNDKELGKQTNLSQFDLGEIENGSNHLTGFVHSVYQNDKTLFINAIDKWIFQNRGQELYSGALVICAFVPAKVRESLGESEQQNYMRDFDSIIHSVTRAGDFVAYLSQYERMFFIPFDNDGDFAVKASKRIIKHANDRSRMCLNKRVTEKCSIGIATFPDGICDAEALFRYADRALYTSLKIDNSYYAFYR